MSEQAHARLRDCNLYNDTLPPTLSEVRTGPRPIEGLQLAVDQGMGDNRKVRTGPRPIEGLQLHGVDYRRPRGNVRTGPRPIEGLQLLSALGVRRNHCCQNRPTPD